MSTSAMLLHIHEHEVAAGSFWQALPHIFGDVIASTLEITCLVIAMMAVIELVNVSSSGKLMSKLQGRPFLQTLIACLLGVIPVAPVALPWCRCLPTTCCRSVPSQAV